MRCHCTFQFKLKIDCCSVSSLTACAITTLQFIYNEWLKAFFFGNPLNCLHMVDLYLFFFGIDSHP